MAAVARRHHAIEHVDAATRRTFDQIERRADAHQVARLVGGQDAAASRRASRSSRRDLRRRRGRRRRSPGNPSRPALRPSAGAARYRFRPARCRKEPVPARRRRTRAALRRRASSARPSAATVPWRARLPGARPAARCTRRTASGCRRPSRHWISIERSGDSMCREPSRCDWNAAPSSVIFLILPRLMTWKPPESVRIGPSQRMNLCRPPSLRDALGARPQHQMIGVAEDDVGAGVAHLLRVERLDRRDGADRHEGRRADDAHAASRFPPPRERRRGENTKAERLSHRIPCRARARPAPAGRGSCGIECNRA